MILISRKNYAIMTCKYFSYFRQERDLEIKPNINDLIPAMAGDPVVMDTPGYPPGSNHHEAHHAARFGVDHGVDHAGVDQHGQHGGPVNHGMDRMDRIERERMNRLDQVVDRLNRVDRENLERADHQRGNHREQQDDNFYECLSFQDCQDR